MEATTDPITLSYLDKLPLLFSPFPPPFSSRATHTLAARSPGGLHPQDLATKCTRCRAEVVGGINGAYWTERGHLWLRCHDCGWTTKRIGDATNTDSAQGKEVFPSVKHRRRERVRRAQEATSHPTQFQTVPRPAASAPLEKLDMRKGNHLIVPASTSRDPSETSTRASPTRVNPPVSSFDSSRSSSLASSVTPSKKSASSVSHAPVTGDTRRPSMTAAPVPPASLDSKLATSKKRKRSKQPNGLAELLAKKKKDESGTVGSTAGRGGLGGGGLGLQDFLKGL